MPYAPRTLDLKSKRLSVEPFTRWRFPLAIRSRSVSSSTTETSFNCSNNQVAQTRRLGVRAGTSRRVTSPDGAPTLAELAECLHDCANVAFLAAVPNQRSCFGHLSQAANSRDVVRCPRRGPSSAAIPWVRRLLRIQSMPPWSTGAADLSFISASQGDEWDVAK